MSNCLLCSRESEAPVYTHRQWPVIGRGPWSHEGSASAAVCIALLGHRLECCVPIGAAVGFRKPMLEVDSSYECTCLNVK